MSLDEYEIGSLLEEKYWGEFSSILDVPWKKIPLPPELVDKFFSNCTCPSIVKVKVSLRNIGVMVYVGQCHFCGKVFWSPNFI